jgi:hypothetical protein
MSGRVPPSSKAGMLKPSKTEIQAASNLYERFTGHTPESVGKIKLPPMPKVGVVIGEIDGVMYTTVRDGVEEKYIHKFSRRSKPLFVVSPDGKQIFLVGGQYNFTERGIVDQT